LTCEKCPKRETCTELCTEMKNLLDRKPEDRLYSDRWIRSKEIPYAPGDFDQFLPMEYIKKMRGGKKRIFNREGNDG